MITTNLLLLLNAITITKIYSFCPSNCSSLAVLVSGVQNKAIPSEGRRQQMQNTEGAILREITSPMTLELSETLLTAAMREEHYNGYRITLQKSYLTSGSPPLPYFGKPHLTVQARYLTSLEICSKNYCVYYSVQSYSYLVLK